MKKILKKIVEFFQVKKRRERKIQHLVNLSMFARDKFQLQFDVNSRKEIKKIERLWEMVYLNPDGSFRTGKETRRIIREMKRNAKK